MGSLEESLQTGFPSHKHARFDAAAEDRLSDLPDCLLHDILSRLGSRQAVQTSTLSRRWRHVWRSVPCVDIDQRQFPGSEVPGSRQRARFEDFADVVLEFACTVPSSCPPGAVPAPLDAFRLHLVDSRSASSERRIRRGLWRRPATVDIHCSPADNRGLVEWPPSHFKLATAACRLTRLTLSGVTLRPGFGERLGALCPVLQDLRIDRCHCHHQSHWTIASPTLKILSVFFRMSYSYPSTVTLAIAAPRLAALLLFVPSGSKRGNPVITAPGHEALASLVEASICLYDRDRPNQQANKTKLESLRSMRGFLTRVFNVRKLRLTGFTKNALLDQESQEFPVLQNLTTLFLRCCDIGAFNSQVLLRILDSTPNLEYIGLYHCKFLGRLKWGRRKTDPAERTSSKQRLETLAQHKNLSAIEIRYQPDDRTHWIRMFGNCLEKMQQWQPVNTSHRLVQSLNVNIGRGDVSNAARIAPVRELTLVLGRLRITTSTCDPVATTRSVQPRVTKVVVPPTRTDSQVSPWLNPTDDDVLSTQREVTRRTEDDIQELKRTT